MTNPKNQSRIFFGWWTVLVTGVVSGLAIGFYNYGISALFNPISSELGSSRAVTSGLSLVNLLIIDTAQRTARSPAPMELKVLRLSKGASVIEVRWIVS